MVYAQGQTIIPRLGVTISKIGADHTEGMKSKIGFTLGAGFNFELNDMVSLQPELNFIQKGFKYGNTETFDGGTLTVDGKETINYLEIPVLVKLTFGDATKFFVNAGPSVGLGLGGKYEGAATFSGGGFTESETVNGKVKFGDAPENSDDSYYDNRLDLGFQLGAGVLIAEKVIIDIRYGSGLTNLYDDEGGEKVKSRNNVFQIAVGIPLKFN